MGKPDILLNECFKKRNNDLLLSKATLKYLVYCQVF